MTKYFITNHTLTKLEDILSHPARRSRFPQCAALYLFLLKSQDSKGEYFASFRYIYSMVGVSPVNLREAAKILHKVGLVHFIQGTRRHPNKFRLQNGVV